MKVLSATLIALALAAFATTASAHVVEITTSIDVGRASNEKDLKAALESTIDDAVKHTIRFTPTVVTVQNARRVGDKIYLVLLIVDHDGEEMIKQLASDAATESPEPLTQPDDIRSL